MPAWRFAAGQCLVFKQRAAISRLLGDLQFIAFFCEFLSFTKLPFCLEPEFLISA
jgi:hypothetical protein